MLPKNDKFLSDVKTVLYFDQFDRMFKFRTRLYAIVRLTVYNSRLLGLDNKAFICSALAPDVSAVKR